MKKSMIKLIAALSLATIATTPVYAETVTDVALEEIADTSYEDIHIFTDGAIDAAELESPEEFTDGTSSNHDIGPACCGYEIELSKKDDPMKVIQKCVRDFEADTDVDPNVGTSYMCERTEKMYRVTLGSKTEKCTITWYVFDGIISVLRETLR